jgi:hypothetical protein
MLPQTRYRSTSREVVEVSAMGLTAFPFDAVLDVTPNTLLGNDTATAAPAKALTTTQVRALLGVYTTAQVGALLSGKSDAGHTHAYSSLTGIPATFAPSAHNQALHELNTLRATIQALKGHLGISKQEPEAG